MGITDAVTWVSGIVFLICVFMVYRAVRERLDQQNEGQRMADAAFEAQLLSTTRAAGSSDDFSGNEPALSQTAAVHEPPHQDLFQALGAAQQTDLQVPVQAHTPAGGNEPGEDFSRQSAEVTCASVITQLRNAGILERVDGFVELNGNPKAAAVLRLKGGRFALAVPYHESEMFTRRNLKKYQMLLYMGRDGKACVVTSLEETIAARVAGSAGF